MADDGDRLGTLVATWAAVVRGASGGELAELLDEHVVWQGLEPALRCESRAEVMALLERYRGHPPRITRLEAQEVGDRVAISLDGPGFPPVDGQASSPPRSLVFTFRGDRVVRIDGHATRDEAFAALEPAV